MFKAWPRENRIAGRDFYLLEKLKSSYKTNINHNEGPKFGKKDL
jgi:hypothetical protein